MSNLGIFGGLSATAWRRYTPDIKGFSTTGGSIVQPILGDPTQRLGKYLITNQGLVIGHAQITFSAADSLGSNDTVWGVSLPARALGATDLPIGTAMLWQGAAANPSLMLVGQLTPMDPLLPAGTQGAQSQFGQVFISKLIAYGSGAIANNFSAIQITHGLGETPVASDIHVTWTNGPSTNPQGWWIDGITSTVFNLNVRSGSTVTSASFAWKIEAEPNASAGFALLMSSTKPWTWASGHSIGFTFQYQLG